MALSNAAGGQRGAVYTLTNAASGNAVLAFRRSPDGPLTPLGSFPTGGNGTGAGLGSQGSVILSGNGALLHAVNAGSNSITSFEVQKDGTLELLGTVSSGGVMPTRLTTHGDVLYVLNAGGSGNITGFSNARFGALQPIPGSTQPSYGLTAGTGSAVAERLDEP